MPSSSIAEALNALRKEYGPSIVSTMAEEMWGQIPSISTGLPSLNQIMGCGGYPKGKITEITGWESSGKSLLCATGCIEAMRSGTVLYVDYENSLDRSFLKSVGVQVPSATFLISRPDTLEQGFEVAYRMVETGQISMVVLDSVGAMLPDDTLTRIDEKGMGDQRPGEVSRAISVCLNQFLPAIKNTNTCALFVNHFRSKIDTYGSGQTTAGGNALKYFIHLRLELRKKSQIAGPNGPIGMDVHVKVSKNKVGPPFGECDLKLFWETGFDKTGSLIAALKAADVLTIDRTGWVKSQILGVNIRGTQAFVELLGTDASLASKVLEILPAVERTPVASIKSTPPVLDEVPVGPS